MHLNRNKTWSDQTTQGNTGKVLAPARLNISLDAHEANSMSNQRTANANNSQILARNLYLKTNDSSRKNVNGTEKETKKNAIKDKIPSGPNKTNRKRTTDDLNDPEDNKKKPQVYQLPTCKTRAKRPN